MRLYSTVYISISLPQTVNITYPFGDKRLISKNNLKYGYMEIKGNRAFLCHNAKITYITPILRCLINVFSKEKISKSFLK